MPEPAKPDPAVEAAKAAAEARTKADLTRQTQQDLTMETTTRAAQFGRRSLLTAGPTGFSRRSLLGGAM